jgi:cysteine desulfuration protein SufE
LVDGKVHFGADSDTLITRGMIALVIRVLNDREPRDIAEADLYFLQKTGLDTNLSPSRANGLAAIIRHMKRYATRKD